MIKFHYLDSNGRRHDTFESATESELSIVLTVNYGQVVHTSKLAKKVDELNALKSDIESELKARILADVNG